MKRFISPFVVSALFLVAFSSAAFALTAAEEKVIAAYSGMDYASINPLLRSRVVVNVGQPPKPVLICAGYSDGCDAFYMRMERQLNAALSQLPDHVGTVYRGEKSIERARGTYPVGQIVEMPAFTSTSLTSKIVDKFQRHENDLAENPIAGVEIVIAGRTGKLIEKISTSSAEREVLFRAGTLFRVISVGMKGIDLQVKLEEVEAAKLTPAEQASLAKTREARRQTVLRDAYPGAAGQKGLVQDAVKAIAFWKKLQQPVKVGGKTVPLIDAPFTEKDWAGHEAEYEAYD